MTKILLVEDESQIAWYCSRGLGREGYDVIIAQDGETGLEMAFGELPDLIVLDVMLPGIDGLTVCRLIREAELQTPILILTAKDAVPDRVAGLEAGADDYLVKPFAFEELLARVRALQRRGPRLPFKDLSQDNPYIVGAPVPPDKFYGRQQMVRTILAAVKAKNHVALYGERRIGKTSLLHRLEYLLKEDTTTVFIPLFIQMQMIPEDKFFGALIDIVLKSVPTSIADSLSPLRWQTSPQPYEALELLNDLETIIKAWNCEMKKSIQLVLLLDEGDRLNEFSEATQMQFRGLLQDSLINQYTRLIWSGAKIDRTWQSDTSPWFNLFKAEFHVDSLKSEEAQCLISEPVAGVYDYEKEAITKILVLTQCKPYLVQRLCGYCIDYLQGQGTKRRCITQQDVETVWANDPETPLRFADLTLNRTTHIIQRGKRQIELTAKECDLLELFMLHPNQVLTRDQIYDRIWGYDFGGESNIIEVYIRFMRSKLEANNEPRLLHTIRGVGYVLREG